jgi:ribosome recycling factor
MNPNQIIDDAKKKFQGAFEHFQSELKKVRTGRAHASMLDGVMVEAYGTQMPLNQVSNVTAPEAQLLQITPFDPSTIQAITSAIRDNPTLGLNPSDDGRIVRVPIPALNEERRREYVKVLGG